LKCEGDCRKVLSRRSFIIGLGATAALVGLGASLGPSLSVDWVIKETIGPGIVNPSRINDRFIRGLRTNYLVMDEVPPEEYRKAIEELLEAHGNIIREQLRQPSLLRQMLVVEKL